MGIVTDNPGKEQLIHKSTKVTKKQILMSVKYIPDMVIMIIVSTSYLFSVSFMLSVANSRF
jgi:hypothetical protein